MPFTFKSTSKQWKAIFHAVFSRDHEPIHCNTSTNKLQFSNILAQEPKLVNSRLPKIKQTIIDYFKKDQTNMLRCYKKLSFYSTIKNYVSRSEYLDLIKNEKARQKKKLRSSNHRSELKLLLPSS